MPTWANFDRCAGSEHLVDERQATCWTQVASSTPAAGEAVEERQHSGLQSYLRSSDGELRHGERFGDPSNWQDPGEPSVSLRRTERVEDPGGGGKAI